MIKNKPEPTPTTGETGNGNRQQSQDPKGVAAKSHEAATRVKDATVQRVEEVKQAADSAKHRASERVRAWGSAVRSIAHHLRATDERVIANYAERASERIEDFAGFIETADPQKVMQKTESIARSNPFAFYGGSLILGLTIGRFIRSSTSGGTSSGREWTEDDDRTLEDETYPYSSESGYRHDAST